MRTIVKSVFVLLVLACEGPFVAQVEPDDDIVVPFFFSFDVAGGHDSNVSGIDESFAGVGTVGRLDATLDGEIAWRGTLCDDSIFEGGVGGTVWKVEHGENSFEMETYEFRFRGDFDLPQTAAEVLGLDRLTFGLQYANWRSRVGGEPFARNDIVTLGVQGSWEATNTCNADNFLVYYEHEDLDDGPVSDPYFSRSGEHASLGAEVTLYAFDDEENCRRPGILRRYVPTGVRTLTFGYRNVDIDAVGEYRSTRNQVYFDGRFPLQVVDDEPVASLDVALGAAQIDYDNTSFFPPNIPREDTPSYIEAAYVRHLKRVDLRVGYRSETNASSNVPRYQSDRDYFFVGLKFERFRDSEDGTGDTGSDGSSSERRGGQSGSSDPVVPGL